MIISEIKLTESDYQENIVTSGIPIAIIGDKLLFQQYQDEDTRRYVLKIWRLSSGTSFSLKSSVDPYKNEMKLPSYIGSSGEPLKHYFWQIDGK